MDSFNDTFLEQMKTDLGIFKYEEMKLIQYLTDKKFLYNTKICCNQLCYIFSNGENLYRRYDIRFKCSFCNREYSYYSHTIFSKSKFSIKQMLFMMWSSVL